MNENPFDQALEFFSVAHALPLLLVAAVLGFLGGRIAVSCGAFPSWNRAVSISAFFLYACLAVASWAPSTPGEFLLVALHGLLAMAVAYGVASVVTPLVGVVLLRVVRFGRSRAIEKRVDREPGRSAEERRFEYAATERTEARRAEERRLAGERAERAAGEQRRRERARLDCELEYARHIPSIRERLPRKEFDDFLARYMNDSCLADEVESRSVQLLALVRQHADDTGQAAKPPSIDDLAAWFVAEKAKIAALPLDDKLKNYHLAELNERYSDLTSEIMRRAAP